ncbi:MAG: hypothetical protein ACLQU5_31035 [Isosphaeraceae bacterium]
MPTFADLRDDRWDWITAFPKKYSPDHFDDARKYYQQFIDRFIALADAASDSVELLRLIMKEPAPRQKKKVEKPETVVELKEALSVPEPPRIQLLRIFNRYVSPVTPVEMLKSKTGTESAIRVFREHFRPIDQVRANIAKTEYHDALSVQLWEFKDRGQFGYDLTKCFFGWFSGSGLPPDFSASGPEGAGKDIELRDHIEGYPHECPTDILIAYNGEPVVAGFARYDSDRGGSQEDDRIGGNRSKIFEIINYENDVGIPLKILFLNDGPGLGLGSMWKDYAKFETDEPARVLVATLKMLPTRLTREWMLGK